MYKKEENFKEKFRQALISTAKVISDDYKSLKNKKKKKDRVKRTIILSSVVVSLGALTILTY